MSLRIGGRLWKLFCKYNQIVEQPGVNFGIFLRNNQVRLGSRRRRLGETHDSALWTTRERRRFLTLKNENGGRGLQNPRGRYDGITEVDRSFEVVDDRLNDRNGR